MGVQIAARELLRPWQINAVHCYDEYFNIVLVYNLKMAPCFIVYLGM